MIKIQECHQLVYVDTAKLVEVKGRGKYVSGYETASNIVVLTDACKHGSGWYIITRLKLVDSYLRIGVSAIKVRSVGDDEQYEDIIQIFALGVIPYARLTTIDELGNRITSYLASNPGNILSDKASCVMVVQRCTFDLVTGEEVDATRVLDTPYCIADYNGADTHYELLDQTRIADKMYELLNNNYYLSSIAERVVWMTNYDVSLRIDTTEPGIRTSCYAIGKRVCDITDGSEYVLKYIPTIWGCKIVTLGYDDSTENDADNPMWIELLYNKMKQI